MGNVLDNFFQEEAIHSELKWSQIQEEVSETVEIVDVFDRFSLTLQLEQLLPLKGVRLHTGLLLDYIPHSHSSSLIIPSFLLRAFIVFHEACLK